MSACGPKRPTWNVRCSVAIGGKADVTRTSPFVSDWPKCDTAGRVRHHVANAESVASPVHSLHTLAAAWLALSISDEAVHCKK